MPTGGPPAPSLAGGTAAAAPAACASTTVVLPPGARAVVVGIDEGAEVTAPGAPALVDGSVLGAGPAPGGGAPGRGTGAGGAVTPGGVAAVVGGAGMVAGRQVLPATGDPRGAGSFGVPAPAACQRQPCTTSASARDPAGPRFAYDQAPSRPCQYDQYENRPPVRSPQPVAG
jgi:hypothetical protein